MASVSLETRQALSERVIHEIQTLLAAHEIKIEDIDLFGVGVGPGGFTSVRVGMATMKGIAFAHNKPIVGVSSLALLARSWKNAPAQRIVIREAYRGEVYAGVYQVESGAVAELQVPLHGPAATLASNLKTFARASNAIVGGSGYFKYREQWQQAWGAAQEMPAESDLISDEALLETVVEVFEKTGPSNLFALEPDYVRGPDAALPASPLPIPD